MYRFGRCGRNDLKLFLAVARKRGKISSGLHNVICRLVCEDAFCSTLPVYSPRYVTSVSNTDASKCLEELRTRNVTLLLLSSGLVLLALCSERPDGMFNTFGCGNNFLGYLSVT
jgi:hypothetical protein